MSVTFTYRFIGFDVSPFVVVSRPWSVFLSGTSPPAVQQTNRVNTPESLMIRARVPKNDTINRITFIRFTMSNERPPRNSPVSRVRKNLRTPFYSRSTPVHASFRRRDQPNSVTKLRWKRNRRLWKAVVDYELLTICVRTRAAVGRAERLSRLLGKLSCKGRAAVDRLRCV